MFVFARRNKSQELTKEQKAEIARITEEFAEKLKTTIEEYGARSSKLLAWTVKPSSSTALKGTRPKSRICSLRLADTAKRLSTTEKIAGYEQKLVKQRDDDKRYMAVYYLW